MNAHIRTISMIISLVFLFANTPITHAAGVYVVSNTNMQEWAGVNYDATYNTNGTTPTRANSYGDFSYGPATPPAGRGSVHYMIGSNSNDSVSIKTARYNGTMLKDITELSYWTYVIANQSTAPNIQLHIDSDNNGDHDETLVYQPGQQHDMNQCSMYQSLCLQVNRWQYWDADQGMWRMTNNGSTTLVAYITRQPDAKLVTDREALELIAGGDTQHWQQFHGYADKLIINSDTWDFEPEQYTQRAYLIGPPYDKNQCKNNEWTMFNNPHFKNQGDCISYVETRR